MILTKLRDRKMAKKVEADAKTEQERRSWCMDKAVWLDGANRDNIVPLAERIYEYVYGPRG